MITCSVCSKRYAYFSRPGRRTRPFLGVIQPDQRVKYYCASHEYHAVQR